MLEEKLIVGTGLILSYLSSPIYDKLQMMSMDSLLVLKYVYEPENLKDIDELFINFINKFYLRFTSHICLSL